VNITAIAVYLAVMLSIAVLLNVGGWYLTVAVLDSLGRRLRFHEFIAVRHLAGRKSGFLTAIGILAILGVSFSSCTLTTVLSVMGGFSDDLKQKIISTNAHVVVDSAGGDLGDASGSGPGDWRRVLERVRAVEGVVAATPVVKGEAMMNARTNNHGILIFGIDAKTFGGVSPVLRKLDTGKIGYIDDPQALFEEVRARRARLFGFKPLVPEPEKDAGAVDAGAPPPPRPPPDPFSAPAAGPKQRVLSAVIVGRELSDALRLYLGDEVNIISPLGDIGPTGPIPKSRPFRVAGVFFSGMYEFDSLYAYISLEAAQKFLRKGDRISEIHIAVADADRAEIVAADIGRALGGAQRVRPWQEINASLFSALKLEKIVMFIFLSFAILVASFCIIATLTMLVLEKGGEISVLMTLGATPGDVRRIFWFEGFLIGVVGTASGLLVGYGLCLTLKHVGLPIDPDVWYIDKLPVKMSGLEFLFVGLASLGITQLATLYPTQVAAGLNPVEGLKNA
jgi:lipoprotein-releasing system permease protein